MLVWQVRLFPKGYAFYMVPAPGAPPLASGAVLRAGAEVNDVRLPGSPPMAHYYMVALRLHRVSSASAVTPRPIYWDPSHSPRVWGRYGFEAYGYGTTHIVPANRTVALWDAGVVTRGFTCRWTYFHMHMQWAPSGRRTAPRRACALLATRHMHMLAH